MSIRFLFIWQVLFAPGCTWQDDLNKETYYTALQLNLPSVQLLIPEMAEYLTLCRTLVSHPVIGRSVCLLSLDMGHLDNRHPIKADI